MSFHRILIALDDSAIAEHAVNVGTDLAAAVRAQVALVYVVDSTIAFDPESGIPAPDWGGHLKRDGQSFLASAAGRAGVPQASLFLREGKPADQILAAAHEWDADVIVIGTHGRSGVSRVVLGSTAEVVVRRAPCPVLVVKPRT